MRNRLGNAAAPKEIALKLVSIHNDNAANSPPGIKGRRPSGQRPTAPQGGRFGEVNLRAERRAERHHKVKTTTVGMPTLRSGTARLSMVKMVPSDFGHASEYGQARKPPTSVGGASSRDHRGSIRPGNLARSICIGRAQGWRKAVR